MKNYCIETDEEGMLEWDWVEQQLTASRKGRNIAHQPEIVVHLESDFPNTATRWRVS
jgi:hypothetical protein